MDNSADTRFTSADADIIKHKVRKLVGHYGFRTSDEADLQQELALHVSKQMVKHDPSRGARSTFVDRIVQNKIRSIIEHRVAQKRDVRKEQPFETENETPQMGFEGDRERMELRLDVAGAIAQLPTDLRELAGQLMSDNKADVGRTMKLSPQQMKTALARIAQHFREMGIDLKS